MKTPWITVGILAFFLAGGIALGQSPGGEELARKYGCFECHSVDENVKGPAFRDIAARYRDNVGRYDLSLISVASPTELPPRREVIDPGSEKKSWLVLARIGGSIHLRIFDQNNKLVVDKIEGDLKNDSALTNLKARFNTEQTSPTALSPQASRQVIANALAAAGYTHREALIHTVSWGGKGNWTEISGGSPMPPHSKRLPDEDIERMVDWILGL